MLLHNQIKFHMHMYILISLRSNHKYKTIYLRTYMQCKAVPMSEDMYYVYMHNTLSVHHT